MREANQEEQHYTRRWQQDAIYLIGWFVVLLGWWLLLVDTLAFAEVLVGVGAAASGALIAFAVRLKSGLRFRLRLAWLRWLWPVPAGVLRDTGVLLVVLWWRVVRRERSQSAFRTVQFPAGGTDPEAATWRAFCTIVTSVTPNTYVIGIDREQEFILVHQLLPDRPEQLRQHIVGVESS